MEQSGSPGYIESKKNSEFFSWRMYQALGNIIMRTAARRRRNAVQLQAMQEENRASR